MGQTFESLVADLSSRFTGLGGDSVDGEIERALRLLVEALGTDRASFLQFGPDQSVQVTHSWARAGIERVPSDAVSRRVLPWYHGTVSAGQVTALSRLPEELPPDALAERDYVRATGMRSNLTIPIAVGGAYVCALATAAFREVRTWDEETIQRVRLVGQILANAVHRKQTESELRSRLEEIQALKERLEAENVYLREELRGGEDFADVVGRSPALRRVLDRLAQVAPTDSTVLLLGETGTGKELLAQALHERSPRRAKALINVNCAALPAALVESELFGHDKGAFTGAHAAHPGRFELADGGTLFLDEVGELPVELQPKLLRVLQDGEVQRLGSARTRKVDARIVAATNQDLERAMSQGRFRGDLYYRLSVFPLRVPPLRERREDIPLLTWAFIQRRQAELGRRIETIPRRAMDALTAYDWPGNVRELHNVLERALILSPGPALDIEDTLAGGLRGAALPSAETSFDAVAREHVRAVLERCGWRINGRGGAAEVLAVHPNTLRSRMRRLGIFRPAATRRGRLHAVS
jgi:transcriptional regulator with GAF, ATPase, and Fis domain